MLHDNISDVLKLSFAYSTDKGSPKTFDALHLLLKGFRATLYLVTCDKGSFIPLFEFI